MQYIVTTHVGIERVAAGRISDVPNFAAELQGNFGGLLIVKTDAEDFARFCQGAHKGRQTRLKKTRRIRGERVRKVPIKVADLYQVVRHKQNEPILITSAFGEEVSKCYPKVAKLFSDTPTVNLFIGAREGIPKSVSYQMGTATLTAVGLKGVLRLSFYRKTCGAKHIKINFVA